MANRALTLESKVKESNVTLGDGNRDRNKIVIQIANSSDESVSFSGFGSRGEITLTVFVGTRAEDLVGTAEESVAITIDEPGDWKDKTCKKLDNQAVWTFRLPKKAFQPKDIKTITIRNFECCTDPGNAKIKVGASISGYDDYEIILEVEKLAETFQLLYFKADPPYIITERDKQDFTLCWNTIEAGKVILYKNNIKLEAFEENVSSENFKNGQEFKFKEDKPSFTTVYKLVAQDNNDPKNTKEKTLTVQVLAAGWHKINFSQYGYPTVICNMDNVKLYGIFKKNGKASLYSSVYPLSVWNLENADVPPISDEDDSLRMETSPAVCYKNKLWLVGGGAADPDTCSRKVFCYEDGSWSDKSEKVPVEFTARMGHSCVVFKKKIWVLGGYDKNHNALKEVWSFDSDGNWNNKYPLAGWSKRCMFAATVYDGMIWLYGGVNDPVGGTPMNDMWTSSDGKNWNSYGGEPDNEEGPPLLPGEGKPIACTLLQVNKKLHLLGAFWRDASVRATKFVLEDSQKRWRTSEIPEAAWLDQMEGNFKLLSAEYKGMVYLTWIDYSAEDTPKSLSLNIYVP